VEWINSNESFPDFSDHAFPNQLYVLKLFAAWTIFLYDIRVIVVND
jgi:hypothetical protein